MRVLLIAAMWAALSLPARSECLPSAEAVWNAHHGSHATWRMHLSGHEGTKCWFARGSASPQAQRIRQVIDSPRGSDVEPRTDGQAGPARSQVSAAAANGPIPAQDAQAPGERAPISILIWGKPMQIDATWDEMFAHRERRGQ